MRAKMKAQCYLGTWWEWTIETRLFRIVGKRRYKNQEAAHSAARRVAKQLNLEVEE